MDPGLKNGIDVQWYWIIVLGVLPLFFFVFDWIKTGKQLSQHNVWLLIISLILFATGILKPIYVRFGSFEAEMRKYANEAVKAADRSDESARLATETAAVTIWNMNKLGTVSNQEAIATELLQQEYGDKAVDIKHFLQRAGILLTPERELAGIPVVSLEVEEIPIIYKIREKGGKTVEQK